jgi:hypothetical protein
LSREAALDNTAIDMAWLGRRRTTPLPRDVGYRQPVAQLQPAPVAAPPPRDASADVLAALERHFAAAAEVPAVPDAPALDDMSMPALSLDAMKERYPLLRNAL